MEIKKFENSLIAFDLDNEMVNATDMIKSFPDKRMNDFLRLKQTQEFIDALESYLDTGIPVTLVKQGGLGQGTWMHRILALKFAAWLSPHFELFVFKTFDSVIKEKMISQQRQLDYFWDKQDQKDLYS